MLRYKDNTPPPPLPPPLPPPPSPQPDAPCSFWNTFNSYSNKADMSHTVTGHLGSHELSKQTEGHVYYSIWMILKLKDNHWDSNARMHHHHHHHCFCHIHWHLSARFELTFRSNHYRMCSVSVSLTTEDNGDSWWDGGGGLVGERGSGWGKGIWSFCPRLQWSYRIRSKFLGVGLPFQESLQCTVKSKIYRGPQLNSTWKPDSPRSRCC